MQVRFYAFLRDIADAKAIEIPAAQTIEATIMDICTKYGPKMRRELLRSDKINDELIILVNGKNIAHLQGAETHLHDSDVIDIFPMVAGG